MSRPGLAAGLRKQVPALQASLGHEWAAVTTAASALDESFAGLAATALTPGDAQLLLKRLAAAAQPGEFPDYASEEQIVMAIPVLGAHGGRPTRSAAVTELLESRKDDDHFGAQRFRRLLEQASR